jgi:hypothetical protein
MVGSPRAVEILRPTASRNRTSIKLEGEGADFAGSFAIFLPSAPEEFDVVVHGGGLDATVQRSVGNSIGIEFSGTAKPGKRISSYELRAALIHRPTRTESVVGHEVYVMR